MMLLISIDLACKGIHCKYKIFAMFDKMPKKIGYLFGK